MSFLLDFGNTKSHVLQVYLDIKIVIVDEIQVF